MKTQNMYKTIEKPLLKWYRENKRELPWRERDNAYYTWVSEIMLQQTRVEAVKSYFVKFIETLPDVRALAAYPEDKLLKLWEGLGYYSRVRNMKKAAIQMIEMYDGQLPTGYNQLLSLKGIGSYTAGAIASIAYGVPVPAVDGNVLRVLSRVTASYENIMKPAVKKKMEKDLEEVIPHSCPGDYNQAIMELGAMICVPGGLPKCNRCPLKGLCEARRRNIAHELPVRSSKKPRKVEERTVFVIQDGERVAISKRTDEGLLAGMYELPNCLGYMEEKDVLQMVKGLDFQPMRIERLSSAKHIFSHVEWRMIGYHVRVAALEENQRGNLIFVDREETQEKYAIPSAFQAYSGYIKEEKQ